MATRPVWVSQRGGIRRSSSLTPPQLLIPNRQPPRFTYQGRLRQCWRPTAMRQTPHQICFGRSSGLVSQDIPIGAQRCPFPPFAPSPLMIQSYPGGMFAGSLAGVTYTMVPRSLIPMSNAANDAPSLVISPSSVSPDVSKPVSCEPA